MNELKIFENKEFGKVRTAKVNGEGWICLKDVCDILEIGNVSQLKTRLKDDGVITNEVIDNLGRKQEATFINENNLYKVIFQSRKKEAERFTDWVTSEVLPSIRKNGGYISGQENMTPEEIMARGIIAAQNVIKEKEAQINNLQLENSQNVKLLESQKPKVIFADAVSTTNTEILIGELAKILRGNGIDIGEKRLFEWLRSNKYLISRRGTDYNAPTQRSMELGLFRVKETAITHSDGHVTVSKTTKVSGKGQLYFVNKFLCNEEMVV